MTDVAKSFLKDRHFTLDVATPLETRLLESASSFDHAHDHSRQVLFTSQNSFEWPPKLRSGCNPLQLDLGRLC